VKDELKVVLKDKMKGETVAAQLVEWSVGMMDDS
jgi:hypothetical protein